MIVKIARACNVLRNHLDLRFGGEGGGVGGGEVSWLAVMLAGGAIAGLGFTPCVGGIDVGGVVWTLPPGGEGGISGALCGGIGLSEDGRMGCTVGDADRTGPGGGG